MKHKDTNFFYIGSIFLKSTIELDFSRKNVIYPITRTSMQLKLENQQNFLNHPLKSFTLGKN